MKINPVDFIYGWNIRNFEIASYYEGMTGERVEAPINSDIIYYPSFSLGWGWSFNRYFSEITLGFGYFLGDIDIISYSSSLKGPVFSSELAFRYRFSNIFSLGLNISPLIGNFGIADEHSLYNIDTKTFAGFYIGPTIALGNKASFYFSLNYLFGHVNIKDVTASYEPRVITDYPQYLDISGLYFRMGLLIRTKHPHIK